MTGVRALFVILATCCVLLKSTYSNQETIVISEKQALEIAREYWNIDSEDDNTYIDIYQLRQDEHDPVFEITLHIAVLEDGTTTHWSTSDIIKIDCHTGKILEN